MRFLVWSLVTLALIAGSQLLSWTLIGPVFAVPLSFLVIPLAYVMLGRSWPSTSIETAIMTGLKWSLVALSAVILGNCGGFLGANPDSRHRGTDPAWAAIAIGSIAGVVVGLMLALFVSWFVALLNRLATDR